MGNVLKRMKKPISDFLVFEIWPIFYWNSDIFSHPPIKSIYKNKEHHLLPFCRSCSCVLQLKCIYCKCKMYLLFIFLLAFIFLKLSNIHEFTILLKTIVTKKLNVNESVIYNHVRKNIYDDKTPKINLILMEHLFS